MNSAVKITIYRREDKFQVIGSVKTKSKFFSSHIPHGKNEGIVPLILTAALFGGDWGEWSVSCLGHITVTEKSPCTH
jgi:hypothetical protein